MDVGEWLKGIGLGQYEATFRAHDIDVDVLPDVTEADLEKIGLRLGARKRLMKAIANLRPADSALSTLPPEPSRLPAAGAPPPRPDAERRPITVMFCDLVGSTSLAAKLDPEDWRNLVNAYLDEATSAVTALGGHVLKKLGDGLMALFGYPQAQENDAERAVRAALAIQRALTEINAKNRTRGAPDLLARIGIESGPVVVETTGEVFGDAPNVAARVQGLAEPGSVLMTMNVQRQVAGLFVAEERGAQELKGLTEPVQLFRVVRASGARRRGGARALTPFVGREEELSFLARRWDRARAGEGQLVLIVGEPGLGKSRLTEEFHSQLTETPHTWSEWSASQLLQNTPLHPIAEWGRQRFGVDASAEQRFADLENTLRLVGLDAVEQAPLIAPLVDIPLPPERAANLPPEELRRRQLAAITALVLAGARSQPVVLVFEDLHWADPTSLDLLRALADRGAQAPLLLLATARPEFRPPWSLRSHHALISLSPLDRAGVARMVDEISARHALSKEVIEGVSERTGGVPLFVEEVTRLLLERGERGGVQAIPPTLQQSLAARLDRLGPAREIAQIGAVLGRDFSYSLLCDVAEVEKAVLQASLERLADADLLFVNGAPPQAAYRFKHALIQDAAYDSLLKSRRQALHQRAAELLRDNPERAAAEPEVIAHHFTAAGLDDQAIEWWGKAGDQALRRSAFQEAIAHLGKAIELADKADEGARKREAGDPVDSRRQLRSQADDEAAARRRRFQLQTAYGNALMHGRGMSPPETTAAFARARALAEELADPGERISTYYGLWVGPFIRGDLASMREVAETFLADAERSSGLAEAGIAHRLMGTTCWYSGDYVGARLHLEQALAAYDHDRDRPLSASFGYDQGVAAKFYLGITLWALGETDHGARFLDDMLSLALRGGHVPTMALAHHYMIVFATVRRQLNLATPHAQALLDLDLAHGLPNWRGFAKFHLARATRGSDPNAISNMRAALAFQRETGFLVEQPLFGTLLAETEAEGAELNAAMETIEGQIAMIVRTGERWYEAEATRVRGEISLKLELVNSAEQAFLDAIAIAEKQGVRSFELRAALSLAKLYQSTARPVEAHAILAPALESFAPTPEMPEIAEAQALLAQLSDPGAG
jgi:class 3 adenylate cyclase/tetratricopeptide (TPR) repeat protein